MAEQMLYRTAGPVTLDENDGDGLTVIGMAVPYGEVAVAQDPGGPAYLETFDRGALAGVIAKWPPRRLKVQLEHPDQPGRGAWVGRGHDWQDTPAGLRVRLRLDDTHDGHAAAFKVRDGQTPAMSLSFVPGVSAPVFDAERQAEVLHRRSVRAIGHVALVPAGTYAGALVEAVRSDLDGLLDAAGPYPAAGGTPRRDRLVDWLATMAESPH